MRRAPRKVRCDSASQQRPVRLPIFGAGFSFPHKQNWRGASTAAAGHVQYDVPFRPPPACAAPEQPGESLVGELVQGWRELWSSLPSVVCVCRCAHEGGRCDGDPSGQVHPCPPSGEPLARYRRSLDAFHDYCCTMRSVYPVLEPCGSSSLFINSFQPQKARAVLSHQIPTSRPPRMQSARHVV